MHVETQRIVCLSLLLHPPSIHPSRPWNKWNRDKEILLFHTAHTVKAKKTRKKGRGKKEGERQLRKSRPAVGLLQFTTGLMDVFSERAVSVFSLQKFGECHGLEA